MGVFSIQFFTTDSTALPKIVEQHLGPDREQCTCAYVDFLWSRAQLGCRPVFASIKLHEELELETFGCMWTDMLLMTDIWMVNINEQVLLLLALRRLCACTRNRAVKFEAFTSGVMQMAERLRAVARQPNDLLQHSGDSDRHEDLNSGEADINTRSPETAILSTPRLQHRTSDFDTAETSKIEFVSLSSTKDDNDSGYASTESAASVLGEDDTEIEDYFSCTSSFNDTAKELRYHFSKSSNLSARLVQTESEILLCSELDVSRLSAPAQSFYAYCDWVFHQRSLWRS